MSDPNTNTTGASRLVLFVVLLVLAGLAYWLLAGGNASVGDVVDDVVDDAPVVVEEAPADNG